MFIFVYASASFADDCHDDNVTSLSDERGHVALYPRAWRSALPDYGIVERRVQCPWSIEADRGRRVTFYWVRSPHDFTNNSPLAVGHHQQTTAASATVTNACHVIIEFIENGEVVHRREACRRATDVVASPPTSPLYESKGSRVVVRVVYNMTGVQHPVEQRHTNTALLWIVRYVGR
jgi:hypothetical protein